MVWGALDEYSMGQSLYSDRHTCRSIVPVGSKPQHIAGPGFCPDATQFQAQRAFGPETFGELRSPESDT